MKKIILFISIIFIMSGCTLFGTQSLTCTTNTTTGNLTNSTTYEIKAENDDIKTVKITYDYNRLPADNDGVNTGTDGTSADTDNERDGIVDGKVGDVINGVADAILDMTGIRQTYTNQISLYRDMNGFASTVDVDSDNQYKVIYEIDLDKMNTTDLTLFNVYGDLTTARTSYENQGLTCK